MLCALGSLCCCSSTLSDNFAAQRLLLNAINGCSHSAAVKFWVAIKSLLSVATIVGIRGFVILTVARWAHPQLAKTAARAKAVWIRRRLLSGECGDSIKTLMGERECLRRCIFLKLFKTEISENSEAMCGD